MSDVIFHIFPVHLLPKNTQQKTKEKNSHDIDLPSFGFPNYLPVWSTHCKSPILQVFLGYLQPWQIVEVSYQTRFALRFSPQLCFLLKTSYFYCSKIMFLSATTREYFFEMELVIFEHKRWYLWKPSYNIRYICASPQQFWTFGKTHLFNNFHNISPWIGFSFKDFRKHSWQPESQ